MLASTDSLVTRNFEIKFSEKRRFKPKLGGLGRKDILSENFLVFLKPNFWAFRVGGNGFLDLFWSERENCDVMKLMKFMRINKLR